MIAAGYVLADSPMVNDERPLLAQPLLIKPKVSGLQKYNFKCPFALVYERKESGSTKENFSGEKNRRSYGRNVFRDGNFQEDRDRYH